MQDILGVDGVESGDDIFGGRTKGAHINIELIEKAFMV
jgi:hypothetical protein